MSGKDMHALIACHECDLLQRRMPLPRGGRARCPRCGSVLYRDRPDSLERSLALAMAGLILFVVANSLPFLSFEIQGRVSEATLIDGARRLNEHGRPLVAALVMFTTILAPLGQLVALLYLLLPLKFGRQPRYLTRVYRWFKLLRPWAMLEIFMVGLLVSVVKLSSLADIVPGLALWAFTALIVVLTALAAVFDPELVWRRAGEART